MREQEDGMSRINVADTVVGELCEQLGLGERTLDGGGRLTLRFDQTPVTLTYAERPVELLWLQVELGPIPAEGTAAPRFLLRLAFDCWGLNRMTIGLDEAGRKAWGFTCIPVAQLSRDSLEQVLSGLLEVAVPIRERLGKGAFELPSPVAQAEPAEQPDSAMLRV